MPRIDLTLPDMADVYAAECMAFTQIYAVMTRSKAQDKHQKHPIQDFPRSHKQDTDISPTMDTDLAAAEIEVVQEEDSAADSGTDIADNTPEIPDDQFSDIDYDKKLRTRAFKPGDWVLRTRQRSNEEANSGKLGENWEGPFIIERLTSKGSYFLKNLIADVLTKP
ncbi:hypothetical protein IFM89_027802 [Coptis chinensis]|uniref:Uncharacterized protein n=1 Tax=Coptis chinensis TaxID=261450 RepID=A0A835IYY4_9MAGN|nr:hypothetical protein IFM89_027802 [Coptis chinensis]